MKTENDQRAACWPFNVAEQEEGKLCGHLLKHHTQKRYREQQQPNALPLNNLPLTNLGGLNHEWVGTLYIYTYLHSFTRLLFTYTIGCKNQYAMVIVNMCKIYCTASRNRYYRKRKHKSPPLFIEGWTDRKYKLLLIPQQTLLLGEEDLQLVSNTAQQHTVCCKCVN